MDRPETPVSTMFRAFARAFGMILGIGIGFFALFFLLALFESADKDISQTYTPEVQPNAKGIRIALGSSGPVILQLNLDSPIGFGQLSADTIRLQLTESREGTLKGDRVKALLLYINSGGGISSDSATIYNMIKTYKEQYKVPVIAYTDGMCASGAYQIALAADTIVSSDCSVIGSIGVLLFPPYFNLTEALEKIGIKSQTVSAGKGKDALNPFRPWQSGEDADIQKIADNYYSQFVDSVTAHRPSITREKLVNEYGAQIFAPFEAKQLGFIDETGYYLPQAIQLAAERAGIQDQEYHVVSLGKGTWVNELFSERGRQSALTKVMVYVATQFSSLRL